MDMKLIRFPEDTSPGGKCLDGTQAGFYFREGSNPKLFMIDFKGGGSCVDKKQCDQRARQSGGSSKGWEETKTGGNTLLADCGINPDFCVATTVLVPNCTGDQHLGTRTMASPESFGYSFHGRTNVMLMIDMLEAEYGLGEDGVMVLLTGGSAGAHAAYLTVDWLAERLPNAVVKAAPRVGTYWGTLFIDFDYFGGYVSYDLTNDLYNKRMVLLRNY